MLLSDQTTVQAEPLFKQVSTVPQVGGKPDFADPVVLSADRGGTKVESLCNQIHKTLAADFLYALVWGTSSKHYPQRCARFRHS